MHAFLINLDRDHDKLASVRARLEAQGISFERIAAISGRDLTTEELSEAATSLCKSFCPVGTVGCFLSHRKAWQTVVDRGIDTAIILEDDVAFYPKADQVIEAALAELPPEWDVLMCGCFTCQKELPIERILRWVRGLPRSQDVSAHLRIPSQTFGSHAYIVSRRGAEKLLAFLPKASGHVDWEMAAQMRKGLRIFTTKPDATYQTGMAKSSIASTAPVALNLAAAAVPAGAGDYRNWAWLMSTPFMAILKQPVNGWSIVFAFMACVSPSYTAFALYVDYMVSRSDPLQYLPLIGAVAAGAGLRSLLAQSFILGLPR